MILSLPAGETMCVCFVWTGSEEASGIAQASSQIDEDKLCGDDPAYVELLNEMEMLEFGLDGVKIPYLISCFQVCLFNHSM